MSHDFILKNPFNVMKYYGKGQSQMEKIIYFNKSWCKSNCVLR